MAHQWEHFKDLKKVYSLYTFYVYLFLSFLLLLFGVINPVAVEKIRHFFYPLSSGISEVIYSPFRFMVDFHDDFASYINAREKNILLEAENKKMLSWINQVRILEQENAELKKELNFIYPAKNKPVVAYIVADNSGYYSQSILIKAGQNHGIKNGNVVLYQDALLGRVVDVNDDLSRVLLLTDFRFRLPVFVGDQKVPGIVQGNNSNLLRLLYCPEGSSVQVGDYVQTSGIGGVYPFGLPVGIVSAIDGNNIEVYPFIVQDKINFVRVLDYGLEGLIE